MGPFFRQASTCFSATSARSIAKGVEVEDEASPEAKRIKRQDGLPTYGGNRGADGSVGLEPPPPPPPQNYPEPMPSFPGGEPPPPVQPPQPIGPFEPQGEDEVGG